MPVPRIFTRLRATLPKPLCGLLLAGLLAYCGTHPLRAQDFKASWITTTAGDSTRPNTWHLFRKSVTLRTVPAKAVARIAVDAKYWLYLNGKLVVYEGGLKRGPNPRDTYYDEVDLAPYLQRGDNTVAVLVWYWGGGGFTHHSSGKVGLLFDCRAVGLELLSDATWKATPHPAYEPSTAPKPNFRLSEPNIRYDARRELAGWYAQGFKDKAWPAAVVAGKPPVRPWNGLHKRPIPLFKDYGLRTYVKTERRGDTLIGTLPYDAHVSPTLSLKAPAGRRVFIHTDTYYLGALGPTDSLYTLCSEYVTKAGAQTYESLGWLSGHEVRYVLPQGVEVTGVGYRETGYHTTFAGTFAASDSLLTKLWRKAQRTLYVNMRDTYMDCPDRERAQWAGDAAMQMAQAFYALDANSTALSRKLFLDLAGWQKPDGVIYNPVPEADWKKELPAHSLMPLSELWRYFRYTHDTLTLRQVYPALRKYLQLWQLQPNGQLVYRQGGWDWGDWGENQDFVLIQHGWYLRALQTASRVAALLGEAGDGADYGKRIAALRGFLNGPDCWNGRAYHHKAHQGLTDDRANALMVVAGVADSTKWEAVAGVFRQSEHASPWMEKFVLESLFLMGKPGQALDRMRRRFGPMTASPLSTLWEIWRHEPGEEHGNSGYNHGWAGGPLVLLSEYVAGIAPDARPGTYVVVPTLAGLDGLRTAFPTPKGLLEVAVRREPDGLTIAVKVPPGTSVRVGMPAEGKRLVSLTHNGKGIALPAGSPGSRTFVEAGPGEHTFTGRPGNAQ
ncbi:MAG: GH78 / CBM67 [uncultured Cytophagales bacterium]|uniref:GH78 / CBM67 n=1 Tax=uncultured Cytophagales bacterium TaxID=158755 RepID=A0A6J4JMU6_9SPHI|nr:MAG: GH78 / CBM67 [uncultured Cytophagales bacterium]